MYNIRKGYNNNEENSYNQLPYQNQPSIGSISKKSTKRQMTRPNLNAKYSQIPRLNELLNDHIFQYYYRTHFKNKEYIKFKYYNEIDKLNFMIDLYFYVMNQANMNEEENVVINENDEIQNEDGIDRLIDNALILDDTQSRLNILEKMKEYKLFDLNWENSYSDRFNKILNKYRSGFNNMNDNEETINYNKTEKNRDNSINEMNQNYTNGNFKTKPNMKITNNNEQNFNKNEESKIDEDYNDDSYYKNILLMNRIPSIYDKIKISNLKMIKMGKLRIKKINSNNSYLNDNKIPENNLPYSSDEYEIKSKKNDINENVLNEYKILKPRLESKIKYNISPILANNENNEIIIQEPMVISNSNIDNCKLNLILKKQINEKETNELIKKIYQFDGDNASFNKNEINKIGIMILNYIRLEKKYVSMEANLYSYKDKMNKMKEKMQILSKKALERIKESNTFIRQQSIKN
jgi:hypothetical protein